MIKYITQDVLKIQKGHVLQQLNCMGKMGKGLAKDTADLYPTFKDFYISVCNRTSNHPKNLLGTYLRYTPVDGLSLYGLFGQLHYGTDKQYTDYSAIKSGLIAIKRDLPFKAEVYIPYMMGCGLGGGKWEEVFKIIEEVFKSDNEAYSHLKHQVFICKKS